MNDWYEFLAAHGGQPRNGIIVSFGEEPGDYAALTQATLVTDIGDLGVLAVDGPEGVKFLQGQTTCDFHALTAAASVHGAFCNPKGRMIADFHAVATASDQILLVMPRDLVALSLQALGKYAAFFKAKLVDRSADYRVLGVVGAAAQQALATVFSTVPVALGGVACAGPDVLLRLAEDRFVVVVAAVTAESRWQQLTRVAKPVGLPFWQLLSIRAGEGQLSAQTSGEFIPQMLNLQALGAISFKKGCYTGQEVVARMQYLGKLKRHMYRLVLDDPTPPPPGTEIFLPGEAQSAGNVVVAAPADASHCEALAVLKVDASGAAQLVFGDHPVASQLAPLPYSLAKT